MLTSPEEVTAHRLANTQLAWEPLSLPGMWWDLSLGCLQPSLHPSLGCRTASPVREVWAVEHKPVVPAAHVWAGGWL